MLLLGAWRNRRGIGSGFSLEEFVSGRITHTPLRVSEFSHRIQFILNILRLSKHAVQFFYACLFQGSVRLLLFLAWLLQFLRRFHGGCLGHLRRRLWLLRRWHLRHILLSRRSLLRLLHLQLLLRLQPRLLCRLLLCGQGSLLLLLKLLLHLLHLLLGLVWIGYERLKAIGLPRATSRGRNEVVIGKLILIRLRIYKVRQLKIVVSASLGVLVSRLQLLLQITAHGYRIFLKNIIIHASIKNGCTGRIRGASQAKRF